MGTRCHVTTQSASWVELTQKTTKTFSVASCVILWMLIKSVNGKVAAPPCEIGRAYEKASVYLSPVTVSTGSGVVPQNLNSSINFLKYPQVVFAHNKCAPIAVAKEKKGLVGATLS